MSGHAGSLPASQRDAYLAACRKAGQVLAEAAADTAALYAEQGALAVGRAAWHPGHPLGTPEAIGAAYEQRIAARQQEAAQAA